MQDIDNASREATIEENGTQVLRKLWKDDPHEVSKHNEVTFALICKSKTLKEIIVPHLPQQNDLQEMFPNILVSKLLATTSNKADRLGYIASWTCLLLQVHNEHCTIWEGESSFQLQSLIITADSMSYSPATIRKCKARLFVCKGTLWAADLNLRSTGMFLKFFLFALSHAAFGRFKATIIISCPRWACPSHEDWLCRRQKSPGRDNFRGNIIYHPQTPSHMCIGFALAVKTLLISFHYIGAGCCC